LLGLAFHPDFQNKRRPLGNAMTTTTTATLAGSTRVERIQGHLGGVGLVARRPPSGYRPSERPPHQHLKPHAVAGFGFKPTSALPADHGYRTKSPRRRRSGTTPPANARTLTPTGQAAARGMNTCTSPAEHPVRGQPPVPFPDVFCLRPAEPRSKHPFDRATVHCTWHGARTTRERGGRSSPTAVRAGAELRLAGTGRFDPQPRGAPDPPLL